MITSDSVTVALIRHTHAGNGRGYAAAVLRQRWRDLSHDAALDMVDRTMAKTELPFREGTALDGL